MIDQGNRPDQGSPRQERNSNTLNTDTLKQQGRDTAHEVGEAAQHQAESYFSQQRDKAAEESHKLTGVLHKMADEFDNQQQPFFSRPARKLADSTERFSEKLRDKDLRSVCDEAQRFSRREPALFIGSVIAAGFLVSRFLRSSSQHSSSQNSSSQNSPSEQTSGANTQPNRSSSAQNLSADGRTNPGNETL